MLEGFQAGLAWITVLRKRDAFRRAFAGFDPEKIARSGARDVARLMNDAGIIPARRSTRRSPARASSVACATAARASPDVCWSYAGGRVLTGDGKTVHAQTAPSAAINVKRPTLDAALQPLTTSTPAR